MGLSLPFTSGPSPLMPSHLRTGAPDPLGRWVEGGTSDSCLFSFGEAGVPVFDEGPGGTLSPFCDGLIIWLLGRRKERRDRGRGFQRRTGGGERKRKRTRRGERETDRQADREEKKRKQLAWPFPPLGGLGWRLPLQGAVSGLGGGSLGWACAGARHTSTSGSSLSSSLVSLS